MPKRNKTRNYMSEIAKLIGNKKNTEHLLKAAKLGKLSHAYIINGAKGSGKKTFAAHISRALLCESESKPCGTCPACIKALTHNHPDIIWVEHEKEKLVSVKEVREQVIYDVDTAPYYGPYKIYIIQDAQLLNESGQNALLKTIEEPPQYVIIFLLTDNAEGLLETIRSRCVRLDMEALPKEVVQKELMSQGVDQRKAKEAAAYTKGNLGQALLLTSESSFAYVKDQMTNCLKRIENLDALEIFRTAEELDQASAPMALKVMLIWYRDILKLKSTDLSEDLYNENDKSVIQRQANKLSFESINKIIEGIKDAEVKINNSVKVEAVFESLLLTTRQEYK